VIQSPDSRDVNPEAEETTTMEAVIMSQTVKIQKADKIY
jgi:hypothetical protein